MQCAQSTSTPRTDQPDWSTLSRDILCPLCDYNLRGLVEPRCPECGHQFAWGEVLTQGDRVHPFLFEHQPHRAVWAFGKTLWVSLRPGAFWRGVLPTQTPNVRRLLLYWMILVFVPVAGGMVMLACEYPAARADLVGFRQRETRWFNAPADDPWYAEQIKLHGSIAAALDANWPLTVPGTFTWLRDNDRFWGQVFLPLLLTLLIWPWLTLGSLLLFRMSLAQARIKRVHVLRCIVYSQDVLLALAPVLILALWTISGAWLNDYPGSMRIYLGVMRIPLQLLYPILLLITWRLWMAYRLYLRFPHALATVVASQLMVGLLLFKLWLMWLGM